MHAQHVDTLAFTLWGLVASDWQPMLILAAPMAHGLLHYGATLYNKYEGYFGLEEAFWSLMSRS
jgi:hypothetical protein